MKMRCQFMFLAPILALSGCLCSPQAVEPMAGMLGDEKCQVSSCHDESTWIIKRVGGDMDATITGESGDYRFGLTGSLIGTELPEGYPAPTPPGSIDIKKYPAARRAEVSGRMNPDLGSNIGFWPLFQHIQRNDIAMTSPVEMDYREWGESMYENPSAWTMSFLYRTADLGAIGTDGRVQVVDTEPVVMLAVGMTGPYRLAAVRSGMKKLHEWLATQTEWEAVDQAEPRAMYYNDPSVPDRRKWMEVQLPVRRSGR